MKNSSFYPIGLLFIVLTACEDMFVKRIDVDQADFQPKLSITATLDTDSGRLSLFMKEAYSLQSFHSYKNINQTIVRNGKIRLYENDREIFAKTGPFDLSTGTSGNRGYHATFTGLSTIAGCTYRLLVEMDGYPEASASAVMPDAPVVYGVELDANRTEEKTNVLNVSPLDSHYTTTSISANPFVLNLADNSPEKDYYALQIDRCEIRDYKDVDYSYYQKDSYKTMIATPDLTLIQDNPDIESKDLTLNGESYDLYGFYLMMLTDATFPDSDKRLDLYLSFFNEYPDETRYYPKPVARYDPLRHGRQTHVIKYKDLLVTHLSAETFKYYRSMAFQNAGIDFFSEPVFIVSNMKNAYGGFSVQNTARISLSAFEGWHYDRTINEEDFIEIPDKEEDEK